VSCEESVLDNPKSPSLIALFSSRKTNCQNRREIGSTVFGFDVSVEDNLTSWLCSIAIC
jgi:hypothetical protein